MQYKVNYQGQFQDMHECNNNGYINLYKYLDPSSLLQG